MLASCSILRIRNRAVFCQDSSRRPLQQARDIAKSFLRTAIPRADRAAISDLASEIEHRLQDSNYAVPILRHAALSIPNLPLRPTPGYLTYLGLRKVHAEVYSRSALRIENTKVGEVHSLVILLRLRG
jgi:hypothetical protein